MNHGRTIGKGITGVADGHCCVRHSLDVRPPAGLLVGDGRRANRGRDCHQAVAEVGVTRLQLGHGLVAGEAGKIHRTGVHSGQNSVSVGVREAEGSDGQKDENCRGADRERDREANEPPTARRDPQRPLSRKTAPEPSARTGRSELAGDGRAPRSFFGSFFIYDAGVRRCDGPERPAGVGVAYDSQREFALAGGNPQSALWKDVGRGAITRKECSRAE